jgi:hypothetical protein
MNRETLPDDEPWLNAVPLRGQTFFANENRTGSILAAHHRSPFDAPNAALFRACREGCIDLAEMPVSSLSRSSAQAAHFSRFRSQPPISMHPIQHMRSQRVIFRKTWIVKIVLGSVAHTEPFHDSS